MSIEELLKPRYLVIADYPDSKFMVGAIIPLEGDETRMYLSAIDVLVPNPQNYPHLFRKLEWWEERKESEISKKFSEAEKEQMMESIKNPKPLKNPTYTCPNAAYGESGKCIYPNCLCQWYLSK